MSVRIEFPENNYSTQCLWELSFQRASTVYNVCESWVSREHLQYTMSVRVEFPESSHSTQCMWEWSFQRATTLHDVYESRVSREQLQCTMSVRVEFPDDNYSTLCTTVQLQYSLRGQRFQRVNFIWFSPQIIKPFDWRMFFLKRYILQYMLSHHHKDDLKMLKN